MAIGCIISTKIWEGKTEWAHGPGGRPLCVGAEGSFAGLTANVPEAEIKKESN